MTSYRRLAEQSEQLVQRLMKFSGLSKSLVANVVQYSKCVCRYGTEDIDDLIFLSIMGHHFNLTTQPLISLMFEISKSSKNDYMTMEEFCMCLCTFLSPSLELKVNFAFKVYDINCRHFLTRGEIHTFLRYCLMEPETGEDDTDMDDGIKELIDIIFYQSDKNADCKISLDEFRELVHKDILYLQLLGPCLPSDLSTRRFKTKLSDKIPAEVKQAFRLERYRLLNEATLPPSENALYPISLELP